MVLAPWLLMVIVSMTMGCHNSLHRIWCVSKSSLAVSLAMARVSFWLVRVFFILFILSVKTEISATERVGTLDTLAVPILEDF